MENEKKDSALKMIIKGTCLGLIFALISVIVFAFIIQITGLKGGAIKAVNQFVKCVAVFVGCFFSLKGKFGFLKGAVVGLLTFVVTYCLFGIISGEHIFNLNFLLDIAFGTCIGMISGIISVNVKKKGE